MMFPSESQYKISVENEYYPPTNGGYRFNPILENGEVVFAPGNRAIVFKVKEFDQLKALKLFTTENKSLFKRYQQIIDAISLFQNEYFVRLKFVENLIYVKVDGQNEEDNLFPGLIMDWVEGVTLGTKIKILCLANDIQSLRIIAENFKALSKYLLNIKFAHGDLKHDNILVDNELNLRLVDYDGIFIEDFACQKSPELGTESFQHPLRSNSDFNQSIDDFSILTINTSLLSLIEDCKLFEKYNDQQNLLFKHSDFLDPNNSLLFKELERFPKIKPYLFFIKQSLNSNRINVPNLLEILNEQFPKPRISIFSTPEINLVGDKTNIIWSTENCSFVRINGEEQNSISGSKDFKLEIRNDLFFEFGNEVETLNTTYQIECNLRQEILFFNAEQSDVKFDKDIELKWSVKHFKKIFLKYDNSEIDVSGLTTLKIKNPGKSTSFRLVVLALSTSFVLEKKVEIKVFQPIQLNVKLDKKVTFPQRPVNIQLSAKNAQKITLLPEGRDITNKKTIQVRTDTFLEFSIIAENACYQSIFNGEISTVPIHKFDRNLVQLPIINISLPAPKFQKLNLEKPYDSNFEKVVIETGKYLDYISPFLWYNQIASKIKNYKKISLNIPFIQSQNEDIDTK